MPVIFSSISTSDDSSLLCMVGVPINIAPSSNLKPKRESGRIRPNPIPNIRFQSVDLHPAFDLSHFVGGDDEVADLDRFGALSRDQDHSVLACIQSGRKKK